MNLKWLESLLYGIVSGFSEFLPISSSAHQYLLLQIFGANQIDPLRNFFVNIALLLSVYTGCRSLIDHIHRDLRIQSKSRRGRSRITQSMLDLKLVKNASLPMLIGLIVLSYMLKSPSIVSVAVVLLLNGIILFIPERMMRGNKDVRSMTLFDSTFIGLSGAISAFTGISRIGATMSAAIARGADRQHSLNWALLLSIPALIILAVINLFGAFGIGNVDFWGNIFYYFLSAIGAYVGGFFSIKLMKILASNIGVSGFAYYSWGASLLAFLLYLTVA